MSITVVDRSKEASGRIWVIRSGNEAKYYNTFRVNGLTAIGHVDSENIQEFQSGPLTSESADKLLVKFSKVLKEQKKSKSHQSAQYNQVRRFLLEVSKGDTILTTSSDRILVGKIESSPYLSREAIYQSHGFENVKDLCNYAIRRNVNWARSLPRKSLPYNVDKGFRNTSTIFEVSDPEKVKSLNHWLYPVHITDEEVRCSLLIKQKEEIPNRDLTNLSAYFDRIEATTKFLANEIGKRNQNISVEQLEKFLNDYSDYNLTTQHAFMSEGLQYVQFKGSKLEQMIFAAMFCGVFANSSIASERNSSELTEIRSLIGDQVALISNEEKFKATKESLKLEVGSRNENSKSSESTDDEIKFEKPKPSEKKIY